MRALALPRACHWSAGNGVRRRRQGVNPISASASSSVSEERASSSPASTPSPSPSSSSATQVAASAASVAAARRRAASLRARNNQQHRRSNDKNQQKQKQSSTTKAKRPSSPSKQSQMASASKPKTQQAAKKKPGYLSLTPEDEAKMCAAIKELRRLETFEPPINPRSSSPKEHATAWAKAAGVSSAAELARRVAEGRGAEQQLLAAHAGLAHALAAAARNSSMITGRSTSMKSVGGAFAGSGGLEHGDFLGEARAALLRAAASFDPSRGASLSTLAVLAGKRSLGDLAAEHGRVVAMPRTARFAVAALLKSRSELREIGGFPGGRTEPTLEEIAARAGLSPAAAATAFAASRAEAPLEGFAAFVSSKAGGGGPQAAADEATEDDGASAAASMPGAMTTASARSNNDADAPSFEVFESAAAAAVSGSSSDEGNVRRGDPRWWAAQRQRELSTRLDALLRTLPSREREAISLRYGLDGGAPRSWAEVGASLRPPISGEAVRKALAKRSAALAVGASGRGAAKALRALRSLVVDEGDSDDEDDVDFDSDDDDDCDGRYAEDEDFDFDGDYGGGGGGDVDDDRKTPLPRATATTTASGKTRGLASLRARASLPSTEATTTKTARAKAARATKQKAPAAASSSSPRRRRSTSSSSAATDAACPAPTPPPTSTSSPWEEENAEVGSPTSSIEDVRA